MNLTFATILGAAAPVFVLIGMGFGLRRIRVLTEEADASLLKLVIRVFYPCLFLDYIIGNPALKSGSNLVAAPSIGFITTAGGFLIAFLIARVLGLKRGKGLRTFSFCNGIYNYGFIPIPVVLALFDDRATLGVLLVHNVGVEVAIWSVGITLLAGQFEVKALKKILSPPLIALLLALAINSVGLDDNIPQWVANPVSLLGACTIPIGIMLAGASVADLLSSQGLFEMPKVGLGSIGVRLGLLPVLFILLAAFLPNISTELRNVIVIQAAMPAGIMPIVLSRHYGGDAAVAVRVVIATTLASVVTMPLWIQLGLRFIPG